MRPLRSARRSSSLALPTLVAKGQVVVESNRGGAEGGAEEESQAKRAGAGSEERQSRAEC